MKDLREPLAVGWRPGPFGSAALCASAMLAAALVIHAAGLVEGMALLGGIGALALLLWHSAELVGPSIRIRSARTAWRPAQAHARAVEAFEFRHGAGAPRLAIRRSRTGIVLRATGPRADAGAFRQVAMWLIVHGRRQARIDAALLDALAAMPDHAVTGQPHDTSHA